MEEEARRTLYQKYVALGPYVSQLEPSIISMMYKEYNGPNTFYPNIGLFFNEFALIYSCMSKSGPNKNDVAGLGAPER